MTQPRTHTQNKKTFWTFGHKITAIVTVSIFISISAVSVMAYNFLAEHEQEDITGATTRYVQTSKKYAGDFIKQTTDLTASLAESKICLLYTSDAADE